MTLKLEYPTDLPAGSVLIGSVAAIKYLDADGDEGYAIRFTGLPIMERAGITRWAAAMGEDYLREISSPGGGSEDDDAP